MRALRRITALTLTAAALLTGSAVFAVWVSGSHGVSEQSGNERHICATPAPETDGADAVSLEGFTIGIDPGHQLKADNRLEQVSPMDEAKTKVRMSEGAVGIKTGVAEYDVNLAVSLKLATMLEKVGADVIMSRTSNDVSVSNRERAELMNDAGVDFWIRIHCNSSSAQSVSGALALVPNSKSGIYGESKKLGSGVLKELCSATGAVDRGIIYTDSQTGFNWSDSPVVTVELGYLSNPKEDVLLCRDYYQTQCAKGVFKGISLYCAQITK